MFLGIYAIDEYVTIPAVTHRFSSGAAYAPTAVTYSIYEEGNTTGLDEAVDMTPASPFDSVTGLYYARRQLTEAAGFNANKTYLVVVAATVDSVAAIDVHVFQVRPIQTGDAYAIVSSGTYGNSALKTLIDAVDDLVDTEVAALTTELAKVPKSDSNVSWNATALGAVKTTLEAVGSHLALIMAQTDIIPASPAAVGSEMNLADDAIKAAKFDESTAFPTKKADTGATELSRTGADADTMKTLSDQIDGVALASVCSEARLSELDAGTVGKAANQIDVIQTDTTTDIPALIDALDGKIDTIDGIVDDILVDTGTTLDGHLDKLLKALVYKQIIDEDDGAMEMFDATDTSLGTIAGWIATDSGYTTRKKTVI